MLINSFKKNQLRIIAKMISLLHTKLNSVGEFCERLIKEKSVLLLPSPVYSSNLIKSPKNHFRIGYGRINMPEGLRELKDFINKNYSF